MSPCTGEAASPAAFVWRTFEILSYGNFLMELRVCYRFYFSRGVIIFAKFLKKTQQLEPNSCGGKCQRSNMFSVSAGS